ncbi:beta-ketoacyl-ACP reductase [Halobacteriaceae archaeon GCM10025711]
MSVNEKTCLVTGSSRGIGRGIATRFGEHGANVVVNYRSSAAEAEDVVDEIERLGGTAIAVQADITDRQEVEDMRSRVHDAYGPVDVLVNNAGITRDAKFSEMTAEEWEQVIDTNLNGAFHTTQAFFEDIKHAEHGRVVNISSVIGKQGNFGQANYAAAKSGLFGLTRSLALELVPYDATCNAVAPGYTETDMVKSVREDIQDEIREQIPLKRFATIEEIASVVQFLAGKESSYITGEVIDVNGAMDL